MRTPRPLGGESDSAGVAQALCNETDTRHAHRHDECVRYQTASESPGFIQCAAAGCRNYQVHHGGQDQPLVKCTSCGQNSCFRHRTPWHAGRTCNDVDREAAAAQRAAENEASERTVDALSKQCPRCRAPIQKNGGW